MIGSEYGVPVLFITNSPSDGRAGDPLALIELFVVVALIKEETDGSFQLRVVLLLHPVDDVVERFAANRRAAE